MGRGFFDPEQKFRFVNDGTATRLVVLAGEQEGHPMTLARPLHLAMVTAAFVFVVAIVIGAL